MRSTARAAASTTLGSATTRLDGAMPLVMRTQNADGAPEWHVTSETRHGIWYVVGFDSARDDLTCTCPAAQYGRRSCRHRLTVRATLLADRAILAALLGEAAGQGGSQGSTNSQVRDDGSAWSLTPEGLAYLAAERRETALPIRDNRPISIWK